MKQAINSYIEILDWSEAKAYFRNDDSELLKIVERISPDASYELIKVRYPYGTIIMDNDSLFMPNDDGVGSNVFTDDAFKKIQSRLNYREIPFGAIVRNTIEIFKEYNDKVFSVGFSGADQGIELGVFEYFGITTCYSVTAGARSVYMVPKVSEARYHKKLMSKFGLSTYPPKNVFRHWQIFQQLYMSGQLETKWDTEIIYFSKKWDSSLKKKDAAWGELKNYLHKKGFQHSSFGRKQVILNLVWEAMASYFREESIKPDPYTVDTLKHLIYIFLGGLPASRPCVNDFAGPFKEIQSAYIDTYGIKQYPTIMVPHYFEPEKNCPVYYSMQHPTLLSSTPNLRQMATIIQEMNSLNVVKDFVLSRLEGIGNIKLNGKLLAEILQTMKLNYYHSDLYSYGKNIRPVKEMIVEDKDFTSPSTALPFAGNGDFIKGCIKISRS